MPVAPSPRARSAATGIAAGGGPRTALAEVQRARIVAATTDVVAELGYAGLTVSEVIARAHISRRTFYELFADREQCFLAAFDAALAKVAEPVVAAYRGESAPWRERIASALCAMLALFDERPALGRLLVVETLAAGPLALERRADIVDALVRAVDSGRASARREPSPLAGEAAVGAVLAVLHARLLEPDRRKPLLALAGALMSAIVQPFLGAAAAERELRRPRPPAPDGHARGAAGRLAHPLQGLEMRVTYRTLRVLKAIEELARRGSPPSNRAVADAAGIADAGQISKLLGRLESLGLIENERRRRKDGHPYKGEPNRWTLAPRGEEVVEAIRDRPATEADLSPAGRASGRHLRWPG